MAKTFKDKIKAVNPAMQFISAPQTEEANTEPRAIADNPEADSPARNITQTRRALPRFDEETKSRRLQLLMTPSLYEAIKERASEERVSVNEFINAALKSIIENR